MKKLFLCLLSVAIAGAPLTAITKDSAAKSEVLPQEVYKQAVPGLSAKDKLRFNKGEKVFTNFWIAVNNPVIPLVWDLSQTGPAGGEWGLGPMFMATNCAVLKDTKSSVSIATTCLVVNAASCAVFRLEAWSVVNATNSAVVSATTCAVCSAAIKSLLSAAKSLVSIATNCAVVKAKPCCVISAAA